MLSVLSTHTGSILLLLSYSLIEVLCLPFLDQWVIVSFRLEIAIASTKLASLLYVIELLYIIDLHLSMLSVLSTLTHMFYLN